MMYFITYNTCCSSEFTTDNKIEHFSILASAFQPAKRFGWRIKDHRCSSVDDLFNNRHFSNHEYAASTISLKTIWKTIPRPPPTLKSLNAYSLFLSNVIFRLEGVTWSLTITNDNEGGFKRSKKRKSNLWMASYLKMFSQNLLGHVAFLVTW